MLIPIRIGIAGFRELREKDLPALRRTVREELKKFRDVYSHTPLEVLTSLAPGAETLCAQEALALGLRLICPLPMSPERYRLEFSSKDADIYDALRQKAYQVYEVGHRDDEDCPDRRKQYYSDAMEEVTDRCFVLLALWDGTPAPEDDCGPASAVRRMTEVEFFSYRDPFSLRNLHAVIYIHTPGAATAGEFPITTTLLEKTAGEFHRTLRKMDTYNAADGDPAALCRLLSEETDARLLDRLLNDIRDPVWSRRMLPGVKTYQIIRHIAKVEGKTTKEIINEDRETLIHAIQQGKDESAYRLLDELYREKYQREFNSGRRLSLHELDRQIWDRDEDAAFANVTEDDFDRLMVDTANDTSLDEFEYIDADYANDAVMDRYRAYQKWKFEKLCAVSLV